VRTARLLLREWRDSDREPFAALKADPVVMEHFRGTATRAESEAMVDAMQVAWNERGYGIWAVEEVGSAPFVGYVGLAAVTFEATFTPATEVGWGLAASVWGRGYATEGAQAAFDFGFGREPELDSIVAFTAVTNGRSARVMERLGMSREPEHDFDHPRVPEGSPVRPHVFYRMTRDRWAAGSDSGARAMTADR